MNNYSALFCSLALAFVLSACAGTTPVPPTTAQAPPTAVPASSTATLLPTAAPTLAPPTASVVPTELAQDIAPFPKVGNADVFGDEVPAGAYKARANFGIPFTFETDRAYRGMEESFESGQIFGFAQGRAELPPKMLLFW